MTRVEDYAAAAAIAVYWWHAAERDLTSGVWQPTTTERRIAGDAALATRIPSPAPGGGPVLWERLARLAVWAPVIRLAMAAGNWRLTATPAPVRPPVRLAGLLTALYGPAVLIEEWRNRHDTLGHTRSEAEAGAALAAQVPGLDDHLAAAERFYTGLTSVQVLLYAVASGDVEL